MFAIESLHIGITFRFVWALMLAVIGFLIVYYIGSTIIAKKTEKTSRIDLNNGGTYCF